MTSVTTSSTRSSSDTSDRVIVAPETDIDHLTEEEDEDEEDDKDEDEDDSENDASSDQSETWLDDPASDIEGDLTRILGGGFKFSGTFYSSHSFPEAPNPCLRLDDLGPIGLPLTEAAAKSIISCSNQAPFGKGESTVVDPTVRDTWEIKAEKVHFNNPRWDVWINEIVVRRVCESLGVNIEKGKPKAELYKLLVYEKGSHFLPHKDTEKASGMFATIIVILPSPFEGGEIRLSHAGKNRVIDTSSESTFSTHVASWYTDVTHSVQPIKSGYRLALSYNLIHTSAPSLKPSVAERSPQLKELKHVLLSWKWLESSDHLIYLLDHQYSASNLLSATLKGKDAHMLKNLRSVAEPLRFEIYLANIELHQTGIGDDEGETIVDLEDEEWTIENAVDLDGYPADLDHISIREEEVIPFQLADVEPDEVEGEGFTGNESGPVEIWYRRTGIVIVRPEESVKRVKNIVEYTKTHLAPSSSAAPNKDEQVMVDRLIEWASKIATGVRDLQVKEALQTLRRTATGWNDADIWLRACRAARLDIHIDMMGVDNLPGDIASFGFSKLRDFLDLAIANGRTDEMRFELAAKLHEIGEKNNNLPLIQWSKMQDKRIIASLRTLDVAVIPILLKEVEKQGPSFLTTNITPQLNRLNLKNEFWIPLITGLHSAEQSMNPDTPQLSRLITSLIQTCCDKQDLFPEVVTPPARSWEPPRRNPDIQTWLPIVQLCFSTKNGAIARGQLEKMKKKIKEMSLSDREWVGRLFFPAAMKSLDQYAQSNPGGSFKEYLSEFCQIGLQLHIEETVLMKGKDYDLSLVPMALRWGGHQCLKGLLTFEIPNAAKLHPRPLQELALSINTYRKSLRPEEDDESTSLQKAVADIALHVAKNDQLKPSYYNYGRVNSLTEKDVLPLTQFLVSVGCVGNLGIVLQRMLPSIKNKTGGTDRAYMEECLLLVLAGLAKQFQEASVAWPNQTVQEFASAILKPYIRDILGRKSHKILPPTELLRFGCTEACSHCLSVKAFLQDANPILNISAAQNFRKHVGYELGRTPLDRFGFRWDTVKVRSPHTLRIQKPPQYASSYDWAERQRYAARHLAILGTLEVQCGVMGSDWPTIYSIIIGEATTDPRTLAPLKASTVPAATPVINPSNSSQSSGPSNNVNTSTTLSTTEAKKEGIRNSQRIQAGRTVSTKKPSQAPKRPFREAIGAQSRPIPEPKRAKLTMEIIEISDSD